MTRPALAIRNRQLDARARPLSTALGLVLRRLVDIETRRAQRDPWGYLGVVRKAQEPPEEELRKLLLRFGLRRALDAAEEQGEKLGVSVILPRTLETEALERKPVKIKVFQPLVDSIEAQAVAITEETKRIIRADVKRTIDIALREETQPSNAALARRIARTVYTGEDGKGSFAFSFERANLIARTEMVQVENTGIVTGMQLAGVERIEWLAYTDGKSGNRHHERMDGKVIGAGEYFVTPLGNRMRYPGDPMAPIEETANCRCTVAPAR